MKVEIYNRLDLINPIESVFLQDSDSSVADFLHEVIGGRVDISQFKNISIYADGVLIPFD